jgi:asparagine synthase (glutamine-hydrolysing)
MNGFSGHLNVSHNTPTNNSRMVPPSGANWRGEDYQHSIQEMGIIRVVAPDSNSITLVDETQFLAVLCQSNLVTEEKIGYLLRSIGDSTAHVLNTFASEFAICYVDVARKAIFLAADVFGSQSLYYAETEDGWIFSSDLASLRTHPGISQTLSKQAIFEFLYFTAIPAPQTISTAIHRIPPGHGVWIDESGVRTHSWYKPQAPEKLDRASYAGRLRASLKNSVSDYWNDGNTACFLSGGLDSSSVCAMASQISRSPVPAFSIGFNDDRYDEIPFARVAAEQFNLKHDIHYVSSDEVMSNLERVASAFGEPFANASTVTALICAQRARKHGFDNLLAGDGGDELFSGNERYKKQMLLHQFQRLPSPLKIVLSSFVSKRNIRAPSIIGKFLSYIRQARLPFAKRLQHYNFIEQYGPENIFCKNFLDEVDTSSPSKLVQQIFESSPFHDFLKSMLFVDWRITLADNDLRKVRTACDIAGSEVRFPMLGIEVRNVAELIPFSYLMPQGRLRGFYKDAFKNILPTSIINKTKHGFGVPVGRWMSANSGFRELVDSRLDSIVEREIISREFIQSVQNSHESDDAVHFGVILWTIFMLETWFQTDVNWDS